MGFVLFGKTVGIVGAGNIGKAFAKIVKGFGFTILAFDVLKDTEMESDGVTYVDLETLFKKSDIISLHCPLNEKTKHLINKESLSIRKIM